MENPDHTERLKAQLKGQTMITFNQLKQKCKELEVELEDTGEAICMYTQDGFCFEEHLHCSVSCYDEGPFDTQKEAIQGAWDDLTKYYKIKPCEDTCPCKGEV
jgi:hypothetical protein